MSDLLVTDAVFSDCRTWRYDLTRVWEREEDPILVNFLLLNPSTADETQDDPTIRRCQGFARAWGYEGCIITNIFAFRATDPADMKAAKDPVGPDNDWWIHHHAVQCEAVVCAWGTHGVHKEREREVLKLLQGIELRCLGKTKHNHPKHPLYLRADTKTEVYP